MKPYNVLVQDCFPHEHPFFRVHFRQVGAVRAESAVDAVHIARRYGWPSPVAAPASELTPHELPLFTRAAARRGPGPSNPQETLP